MLLLHARTHSLTHTPTRQQVHSDEIQRPLLERGRRVSNQVKVWPLFARVSSDRLPECDAIPQAGPPRVRGQPVQVAR